MTTTGHYHDPQGKYDYCADPRCPRTAQATTTPVADALQEVDQAGTEYGVPSAELLALRKLAAAVRSHGIGAELGQLREARAFQATRPMGWRAEELAEGTTPQAIPVERVNSQGRRTGASLRELVLIPAHDGQPARFVITDLKSGHGEAYELPQGVRLAAVPALECTWCGSLATLDGCTVCTCTGVRKVT